MTDPEKDTQRAIAAAKLIFDDRDPAAEGLVPGVEQRIGYAAAKVKGNN
jgi:hypothetical protein